MDVSTLTMEQVNAISSREESHLFDRKSRNISPAKLTKTLSAFANADGGEILIGVEDDGEWAGAPNVEFYNGMLQAFEVLFPYGTECNYEFFVHPESQTVAMQVSLQKSREIKYATDERAYIRRGAQSLPVQDIEQLKRQKGLTTLETATLKYDFMELVNSPVILDFTSRIVPTSSPEPWLRKQNLIINDLPTVAGTLLFHEEPQIHMPRSAVKIYRYNTTDQVGSREHLEYDPMSLDGSLSSQVRNAVRETVTQIEKIPALDSEGLVKIKYPEETLHEIITNALIHRDYSVNDDVHVRIFDNRIEVQSPGGLPANITSANILEERFSRNPMIVRLLNKFPDAPNKDVGEGLNTAFEAMRNLDLRDPEIRDTGTSVLVVIWHESLASPESRIMEHVRIHGTVNNREARNLLNRPEAERSIRRLFESLIQSNVLERVPSTRGRGARYRATDSDHSNSHED